MVAKIQSILKSMSQFIIQKYLFWKTCLCDTGFPYELLQICDQLHRLQLKSILQFHHSSGLLLWHIVYLHTDWKRWTEKKWKLFLFHIITEFCFLLLTHLCWVVNSLETTLISSVWISLPGFRHSPFEILLCQATVALRVTAKIINTLGEIMSYKLLIAFSCKQFIVFDEII